MTRRLLLKPSLFDKRDYIHEIPHMLKPSKLQRYKTVDLRPQMPQVLDQETLAASCCNAISNVIRYLLKSNEVGDYQPSRLYLYWNARVDVAGISKDTDCDVSIRDMCKAISRYSICEENLWDYDVSNFNRSPPLAAYKKSFDQRQIRYARVVHNLPLLRWTLSQGLPVVVGLQCYDSFVSQEVAISGIVPVPNLASEQCVGSHATVIVGYNDITKRFTLMNSWGKEWGKEGYFEIDYDYILDKKLTLELWVISFLK